MKRLFLTILCGVGLSLNLVADENLLEETNYKRLEKNISNLPKTEQEKVELNKLFTAILNTDFNTTKEILDNNPNLINLLNDNQRDKISLLGHIIMAETTNEAKIDTIMKYSKIFALDINQICLAVKSESETLFYIYYPLSFILLLDNDGEKYFDLFKFFAKNKTNATNSLYYIVTKIIDSNDENLTKYLQSDEYKILREKYKKYIYEIFENYNTDDFSNSEIISSGIDFIKLNDTEFIKLLIDSGLKNNKFAYNEIFKFAKNNKNKEILNLLKGE